MPDVAESMAWERSMAQSMVQFSLTHDGSDYVLGIEDEDGETHEFLVSFEQLDLINEAIEQLLDADEDEALDDDGDEDEE